MMDRKTAFLLFAVGSTLGACSHSAFDLYDQEGQFLLEGRRGGCFVGCTLRVRLEDGSRCRGHVAGINEGYPLNGKIYCDNETQKLIKIERWIRGQPVAGTLDGHPTIAIFR